MIWRTVRTVLAYVLFVPVALVWPLLQVAVALIVFPPIWLIGTLVVELRDEVERLRTRTGI